jgi:peroxiredoxin
MLCRLFWIALACGVLAVAAAGGEYNPTLNIGDAAPVWADLPGVDDRRHSLADLAERKVVVVVFTCNSCPYAVDHEDRLLEFARKYQGQSVALVAINVNKVADDLLPAMKDRARAKNFSFPYLFDETQAIARKYGATYTPEFFAMDQSRRIIYMGAMDDSPDGKNVKVRYLEQAVDAALKDSVAPVAETIAVGCQIRYERQRRK